MRNLPVILLFTICVACAKFSSESEEQKEKKFPLTFTISETSLYEYLNEPSTKNILLELDTNKFLLKISSSLGEIIYNGKYKSRPSEFFLVAGNYDVELYSDQFEAPQFDTPLIGDKKTIMIGQTDKIHVTFRCKQINSGLKLTFTNEFKEAFPGSGVRIVQNNNSIAYNYLDSRYIYVNSKSFEIHTWKNGIDTLLLERTLTEGTMMHLNLTYAKRTKTTSFSIICDTSRTWNSANLNLALQLPTDCLTIAEAQKRIGEYNIMVFGYIFGGDPTTNSVKIKPPFTSRTTIVIAPSMNERNRNNCMAVELPIGSIRDALNLVVNPELLGTPIILTGNVTDNYYNYTGLKSLKNFIILD